MTITRPFSRACLLGSAVLMLILCSACSQQHQAYTQAWEGGYATTSSPVNAMGPSAGIF